MDLRSDEEQCINFKSCKNYLTTVHNLCDILVHLGCLALDRKNPGNGEDGRVDEKSKSLPFGKTKSDVERAREKIDSDGTMKIPNHEIYEEFLTDLQISPLLR